MELKNNNHINIVKGTIKNRLMTCYRIDIRFDIH